MKKKTRNLDWLREEHTENTTKNLEYVKVCCKEENKFPVTGVQKVIGSSNLLSAS